MKGYHYLMHIACMLNEMAIHSVSLIEYIREVGIQSFIKRFYIAMVYVKLETKRLRLLTQVPGQLRLVLEEDWKTNRAA